MKRLILAGSLALSFWSFTAFADTFLCKSDDFGVEGGFGQGLNVQVNDEGTVTKVSKVEGSYYSDWSVVDNPPIVAQQENATVYALAFDDDSKNDRLIVKGRVGLGSAIDFTFYDQDSGFNKSHLTCVDKID